MTCEGCRHKNLPEDMFPCSDCTERSASGIVSYFRDSNPVTEVQKVELKRNTLGVPSPDLYPFSIAGAVSHMKKEKISSDKIAKILNQMKLKTATGRRFSAKIVDNVFWSAKMGMTGHYGC